MKKLLLFTLLCLSSIFSNAQVIDSCDVTYSYTDLGNGLYVFTNTSPSQSIFPTVWDFGMNGTYTGETVTVQVVPGSDFYFCMQPVMLCDTNAFLCDTILVNTPPPPPSGPDTCEVDFSFNVGVGGTVNFTNGSGAGFNSGYYYNWIFGDGSTSTNAWNPSHTYASPGTYTVCFQAVSCECPGQLFEVCYDVTIDSLDCTDPTIQITQNGCGNYVLTGINNSGGGTPCWYVDGQLISIGNDVETYSFTQNGTYVVCYNVVGGPCNFNTSVCDTIVVDCFQQPCNMTLNYTAVDSCTFVFDVSPYNPNASYYWNIGGQTYNGTSTITHQFNGSGPQDVYVFVSDSMCAWDDSTVVWSFCDTLDCTDPTIQIAQSGCGNYVLTGINNSGGGTPCWYVDGQLISIGNDIETYSFTQNGTYLVCYNVVGGPCNFNTSICDTIVVNCFQNCNPILNVTTQDSCTYVFNVTSGIPGAQYYWNMDGQSFVGNETVTYTFGQGGYFPVTVSSMDSSCNWSFSTGIYSYCDSLDCSTPAIQISENGCGNYVLTGINNSGGGTPCWYVDGQLISIGNDIETYSFTQNGTYLVCYNVVGGPCNFNTSTCDTIVVDCFGNNNPCNYNLNVSTQDSCTYTFDVSPANANSQLYWIIDGQTYTGSSSVTHTFTQSGFHDVFVSVSDSGCYWSDTLMIYSFCNTQNPCDYNLNVNTQDSCSYVFNVTPTNPNAQIYWAIDNQTYTGSPSVSHTFSQSGMHSVYVSVSEGGCFWSDTLMIWSYCNTQNPCDYNVTMTSQDSCSFVFDVLPANPNAQIYWAIGGQTYTGSSTVSHTFNQSGLHDVFVSVSDSGCYWSDTLMVWSFCDPLDTANCNGYFDSIVEMDSCFYEFTFIKENPNAQMIWYIDGQYAGGGSQTIWHQFTTNGQHTIEVVVSSANCVQTYTTTVYVSCCPNNGPQTNTNITRSLFPNPANGNVTFTDVDYMRIYDNMGRLVLRSESNTTDVSLLEVGEYIVKGFVKDQIVEVKKLVVKK